MIETRGTGEIRAEFEDTVLKHLRGIEATLDSAQGELSEITVRFTAMEGNMVRINGELVGIGQKMDRIDERLGRMERRLEMIEARCRDL